MPRIRPVERGFTLLELLVVIAIIAIIALLIITNVDIFKSRGANAGVQRNLVNARSEASEFYLDNGSSYANLCQNATIRKMMQAAAKAGGITPQAGAYANGDIGDWNSEACHSNSTAWAMWVPLSDSTNAASHAWCVDSTNISKEVSGGSLGANAVACP